MRPSHCVVLLSAGLLASGCRQTGFSGMSMSMPLIYDPPVMPKVAATDGSNSIPPLDFKSLELGDFLPPGATPIWPVPRIRVTTYDTPRGKFPSTEESIAPDNNAVVGSRSALGTETMQHRLRFFRRGEADSRVLLNTTTAFDTVWARDSQGIAITHYTGKNHADVLVTRVDDLLPARKVEIRAALEQYFSPALLDSPRFEIAYRWSDGRMLVVRGIGRLGAEPYDIFGYEVVVDSSYPEDASRMSFLRGYLKPGKPLAQTSAAPLSPHP